MHIEFIVEEPSAEAALQNLVPKIVGEETSFVIHVHQGKGDLLQNLSNRLRGYRRWLPVDWCIVVLIDEDRQDCHKLKTDLEGIALKAGFATKTTPNKKNRFEVLNRLAIEELEAWFFGDVTALRSTYPRVSPNLGKKAKYRDPDAIKGGTWEALERVLQAAGYHRGGLAKIAAAREISDHMDAWRSTSRSFQVFRDGLMEMAGLPEKRD